MEKSIYAVIMAGGSGTRFWPASRSHCPKQFLRVVGEHTLLQGTWHRLLGLVDPQRILVVCGSTHATQVRNDLPQLPDENLIIEPCARNTLPCLALAQGIIHSRDPNSVQIVLPADHVISPSTAFQETLREALNAANTGSLVTLGIQPTSPATEYGYIRQGAPTGSGTALHVDAFEEKPNASRALELLGAGGHYWNSGIFVWSTQSFGAALKCHTPELDTLSRLPHTELTQAFAQIESVSVDVGILEKETNCQVVPARFQWSDVGSWPALTDVLPDAGTGNRNAGGGDLVSLDAADNVVHGPPGHLTALVGVSDLVVVHTEGASLVCPKERAQDVRSIVSQIATQFPDQV